MNPCVFVFLWWEERLIKVSGSLFQEFFHEYDEVQGIP